MNGVAVILHSVKHPSNNVKYPGISDTFHVKMMALKQINMFALRQWRHLATKMSHRRIGAIVSCAAGSSLYMFAAATVAPSPDHVSCAAGSSLYMFAAATVAPSPDHVSCAAGSSLYMLAAATVAPSPDQQSGTFQLGSIF